MTSNVQAKQGYKNTELGWIPDDWDAVQIGDLCQVKRGASPRPINDSRWWGNSAGWVRISDVTASTKYLNFTKTCLSEEGVKQSVKVSKGEVILSICATMGVPIIINMDACIHDGFVWFDKLTQEVDREFLYYFLQHNTAKLASNKQTGTQGNLNTSIIAGSYMPLIKKQEQQKIAEIFCNIDEKIGFVDKQIEQAEQLKKALMQELLTKGIGHSKFKDTELGRIPIGWEIKKGKEITSKITKGASPKWQGFDYQGDGTLFVTSENVRDGYLDITTPKFLPLEFNDKLKNSQLKKYDILINIVGASIGRTCQYLYSHEAANINQAVCLFRLKDITLSEFILYYLQAPLTISRLLGTQNGSARQNLSLNDINNFIFVIPTVAEQKEIAEVLSAADQKLKNLQSKKSEYEKLKKGLMQKLLTGQIRVSVAKGQKQPVLKTVSTKQKNTEQKAVQPAFVRAVLAAEITAQLYKQPTFGSVKQEKIIFLCESHLGLELGRKNYREAAGPYDPHAKRSLYINFQKLKWFNIKKEKGATKYVPADNFGKHKQYFDRYFSEQSQEIQKIIDLFKTEYTQTCEIVATLYGVWNDFIIDGRKFNDNDIINEVLNNWHDEKKNIERWKWVNGLQFIRQHNLVPAGKGSKTLVTV